MNPKAPSRQSRSVDWVSHELPRRLGHDIQRLKSCVAADKTFRVCLAKDESVITKLAEEQAELIPLNSQRETGPATKKNSEHLTLRRSHKSVVAGALRWGLKEEEARADQQQMFSCFS
jgi:hypothetical protein